MDVSVLPWWTHIMDDHRVFFNNYGNNLHDAGNDYPIRLFNIWKPWSISRGFTYNGDVP